MSINVNCNANPKNAHIKKTSEGKSPDYISLETIKNADITTVEGLKIRNKAIVELRDRYEAAIEGSKRKLIEMCKGHPTVLAEDIIDNYAYDCYEHFMMAVNGMDLKRIQHMKGSYSFYIQLVRYLAAYNRKIINQYAGGQSKARPLTIYRKANDSDNKEKICTIKVGDKNVNVVKLKSSSNLQSGCYIMNQSKVAMEYNPDLVYIRDTKGRLMKVIDNDEDTVLEDDDIRVTKFNAYNVRSEWMSNSDGGEMSVFNTDRAGTISIDEQMEHEEESRVLREAIDNAFKKFSPIQQEIWNKRMTQSAEQFEKKLSTGKSGDELYQPSRPKYEGLGKMCNISPNEVKQNMKAMRTIISLEVNAANRKYNTDIQF